ncbi:probable arginine--tRNA ligase, mitochondrial [Anopheles ziemanni]|uniref:probable arginine--tRNA ligase, mitochondrial n=1 Tax=Anopheles ziemanni TaxID=345580 RepID=UPI00265FF302|nr:probable arginine--tRNA ligase, mitochondrial [Anopheles ziemanni]
MAYFYRKLLTEKVSRLRDLNVPLPVSALKFTFQKTTQTPELHVPLHHLGEAFQQDSSNTREFCKILKQDENCDEATIQTTAGKRWLKCVLNKDTFISQALTNSPCSKENPPSNTIVVEFSSPNIAKPFHAGHLRSTIIGNFISNINEHLGNRVVRLNYLGDWGTQFGYLALGVHLKALSLNEINKNPIKCLYDAYVHAYNVARDDPKMHTAAMDIFASMEHGTTEEMQNWQEYRAYTVKELEDLYRRLGVRFSSYEWESSYSMNKISHVLNAMKDRGILHEQLDGRLVIQLKNRTVPLVKSDGTGMYILRDVAALMDRHVRYSFEKCLYVVENGQNDHFVSLSGIAHAFELPYANDIEHIKFGRIHGMSTRRGQVVFLKDILHEAQELVLEKQKESPNTRANAIHNSDVCDILGASAVIINDLKQRRMKDYQFEWSKILQMDGDSGIKLQYTHCRLVSLIRAQASDVDVNSINCAVQYLPEAEASEIICQLANFEPVCHQAQEAAEACILVAYLFRLCKSTNLALKVLHIKHEPDIQKRLQRILLFNNVQKVLCTGMELLGLTPLEEM